MLKANYTKYTLHFKQPSGTSRGVYTERDSWFIIIEDTHDPDVIGIGECAPLPGLSQELDLGFLEKINEVCNDIEQYKYPVNEGLRHYPSIWMGLETALLDYQCKAGKILFPTDFTEGKKGIKINGLVWMGKPEFMRKQVQEKIDQGYNCIKLKIGAIDFKTELSIINDIRKNHPIGQIQIRVDANGAFKAENAMANLEALAKLGVHSIEQPIAPGNMHKLAQLCEESPIPIALDEELIGHSSLSEKQQLVDEVKPQFLILKPSLHGSLTGCKEWINIANSKNIGWWATSALESNIGLNAIAQWVSTYPNNLHQGLGTGQLFTNNFDSPLFIKHGQLMYDENHLSVRPHFT